ncbi:hypothetical protein BJ138DRAFT_1119314 [Hygrophoropsis aurantiaca]|uniref:Uncharacterized protein n=1 Tax=Hygrophoropsis aurantiaca TaxID=72124 RepID=A0ACB7ZTZ5_9AGAM|nr:hypothetical protein BJ138DRAFT_1119314 [Hygrophoropsis aurantiaca]
MAENRARREAEEASQLQTAMAASCADNNGASGSNTHGGASGSNAQAGASSSSSHTTSSREIMSYNNIDMVAAGDLPRPGIDEPETDMDVVHARGVPCPLWEISEWGRIYFRYEGDDEETLVVTVGTLEYRFTGADKAKAESNIRLGIPPWLDNVRQTAMPLLETYERWQELYDQARDDCAHPAGLVHQLRRYLHHAHTTQPRTWIQATVLREWQPPKWFTDRVPDSAPTRRPRPTPAPVVPTPAPPATVSKKKKRLPQPTLTSPPEEWKAWLELYPRKVVTARSAFEISADISSPRAWEAGPRETRPNEGGTYSAFDFARSAQWRASTVKYVLTPALEYAPS